ncbi:hypothetical protein, partial [Francisella tularensis]|uniref:hypothetical protein n=1 Tax=Francisella tularensis TaxID=263 RepID=UPI00296680D3
VASFLNVLSSHYLKLILDVDDLVKKLSVGTVIVLTKLQTFVGADLDINTLLAIGFNSTDDKLAIHIITIDTFSAFLLNIFIIFI